MFVIEVIPLKRGIHVESLSYFSSTEYPAGTILTIPVRNQEIRGVVLGVESVSAAKTALRAATFSLKKLPPQENVQTLSPSLIETANELAEYYACQPGAALWALLLPEVRDGATKLPYTHHTTLETTHTPEVLQGTLEERYLVYTSLVRETLAHGESLLFVVPSPIEAEFAREQLGFGIEERTIVLTSALGTSTRKRALGALEDFAKSKLIITTPPYAIIERHDISITVLESEQSRNYRARSRPYFDYRCVIKVHARNCGRRLIFGDLLIRTEEETLRRDEKYETYEETPKRLALSGTLTVVRTKDKPEANAPFRLFAPKVLEEIEKTHKAKGRVFLFAPRRGLAPVIACLDCGYVFRSPESGAPYSLVRTTTPEGKEQRWFVCSVSGERVRAADVCEQCGSWRLRGRGIGIQHVYDELRSELPHIALMLFDYTSANTYKKATFLRKKFYETKGAVMVGTQMALPYLTELIDTSVVVSMDSLRATPTWHQEELTLSTLFALREHTTGTVYVQTRTNNKDDEKDPFIEYARKGTLGRFYDEEIELRKQLHYPPFAHFVHLTWQGNPENIQQTEDTIKNTLVSTDIHFYSAPPTPKGPQIRYGLIRLLANDWPKKELVEQIRTLPPSVRVIMNPDRIV